MSKHTRQSLIFGLLIALHIVVVFPGFFGPYAPASQDREHPFAPPTRPHFVDAAGQFHLRPFVYASELKLGGDGYAENSAKRYPVHFFAAGERYEIVFGLTSRLHLFAVEPPARICLFGTDDFGRDEFSRMLYGGRISVLAGLLGTAIALFVGVFAGLLSGFYGSWIDAATMRLVELFLALPWLYLLFAFRAILPLAIKTTDAFLLLVTVIGLVGWARPARLIRGIALTAKERDFVLAARAMGASDFHILRKHILPQTYGLVLTLAALLVPQFILAEVTLSFLGLGVGEPIPSWGNLLAELQTYRVLTSYWWMYLPACALVLLFLAYHSASSLLHEKTAVSA
jgi:peptide/nickel transport system permease protein